MAAAAAERVRLQAHFDSVERLVAFQADMEAQRRKDVVLRRGDEELRAGLGQEPRAIAQRHPDGDQHPEQRGNTDHSIERTRELRMGDYGHEQRDCDGEQ